MAITSGSGALNYAPGEHTPPALVKGPGHEALNVRFEYIYSMLILAWDDSVEIAPGTADGPGRIRATAKGGGPILPPLPFSVVKSGASSASAVYVQVTSGTLRADSSQTDGLTIDGLEGDFAISAGDSIWLQIDTTSNEATAASVEHGSSPPYGGGDGGDDPDSGLVTSSGSGEDDDPYLWDETFLPIARVFSSGGTATHGGRIFKSGDGTTALEVVQLTNSNLCMRPVLYMGFYAMQPFPDFGAIAS